MASAITLANKLCAADDERPAMIWRLADVVVPIVFMAALLGSVITIYHNNIPTTTAENSITEQISKVAVWP